MVYEIITNKALVTPICAWVVAQTIKTLVSLFQGKGFDLGLLLGSGGMPSAHSAFVTALATAVAMIEGFGSVAFAITTILALIVMYDAAGVRQSVAQQSTVLNRIIEEIKLRRPMTELESDLRELMGHTPFQVVAGAALGIAIAWLWLALAGI
ncbi:divergent PAP2 family protein [Chloroflexota bacterium]